MTFVVATGRSRRLPHWVKVSEVFKTGRGAPFLERAGIENISDPRYTKYSQRLARLRDIRKYTYRMDVLERRRSRPKGSDRDLRTGQLARRQAPQLRSRARPDHCQMAWRTGDFPRLQQDCAQSGFPVELWIHLRNMVAFATGQSRFLAVGSLKTRGCSQHGGDKLKRGMEFALNFLKTQRRDRQPGSTGVAVPPGDPRLPWAQARLPLNPRGVRALRFWVLLANAKGRYSRGSSETILDQDLATLRDGGTIARPDRPATATGRVDSTPRPEELRGRNQRSALFKTMFLAFRKAERRTGARTSR